MTDHLILASLLALLVSGVGLNIGFWSIVGILRLCSNAFRRPARQSPALGVADVAVVIPAHNEEVALPKCIRALMRILPPSQIFLASDGSKDRTAQIAMAMGCNVIEIYPNGGKARALQTIISENRLCQKFKAILIQDADSEIDPDFLNRALPLFDDPKVVVVAGHVLSRWPDPGRLRLEMLFTAYRTRLYRILQAAFQYGQSWKWMSVSYIAPGFTSMYRTSILNEIEITAPGLVIEDFNMTFEVQRKKLGRIAYTPRARCSSEDPTSLRDYTRQVARWYLGFWQTVCRHGVWPGKFWVSLLPLLVELIALSVLFLMTPLLLVLHLLVGIDAVAWSIGELAFLPVSPMDIFVSFLVIDYGLTIVVAAVDRRPALLAYGFLFPLLRLLDSALFLSALVKSFCVQSDGRWTSPARHGADLSHDISRRSQRELHAA